MWGDSVYQSDELEEMFLYELDGYQNNEYCDQEEIYLIETEETIQERLIKILSEMDY